MAGLLFPTSEDFFMSQGANGPLLCTKVNGICLMLFYSTKCVYCKKLIPIFNSISDTLNGAYFAMVNVFRARDVCTQSKQTNTPITYVPLIILYINNKPYMKYSGPHDINTIRTFVIEASQNYQKNNVGGGGEQKNYQPETKEKEIPEYSMGVPLCGMDGRCYLKFDDAYDGEEHKVSKSNGPYKGSKDAYVEQNSPYTTESANQYGAISRRRQR